MKTNFPWLTVSAIGAENARAEAKLEAATMRLLVVSGAADFPLATQEVDRREELFAKVRRGSPRRHEHPRLAALESVAHDAAQGRLS